MPNYQYVIDSSFKPFTFDEMLKPWVIYSNAYEKAEEEYNKLSALERFKDLVSREGEEEAAKIYNAYADEYDKQYKDFAENGLNISNRRGLTNLRRRYKGEIGALEEAEKRLNAEMKTRDEMRAKGLHMLYNNENLKLSNYLHGNTPNLYGISTEDLYKQGEALGKSLASSEYDAKDAGSALNGYYRIWEEIKGVPPERLAEYMAQPHVQALIGNALIANGTAENLTGHNLEQAKLQFLQGLYNSVIGEKSRKLVEDKSRMTPYQEASLAQSARATDLSGALYGKRWDGRSWVDDDTMQNVKSKYGSSSSSSNFGSGKKGASYSTRNKKTVMVGSSSGKIYKAKDDEQTMVGTPLKDIEKARVLTDQERTALVDATGQVSNQTIKKVIGDADLSDYEIYVLPSGSTDISGSGIIWNDELDEDVYIVVPRDTKRVADNGMEMLLPSSVDDGTSDIAE